MTLRPKPFQPIKMLQIIGGVDLDTLRAAVLGEL